MTPLRIFIGYDPNETVALQVLTHSIYSNSTVPVSITPIIKKQLRSVHKRKLDPQASTQFSFTRFLVPYLSNYTGWSLFMDCDMLVKGDVAEVFDLADDKYSVMCCKHEHKPTSNNKFLGNVQTKYEKKNWSSFMLMNNIRCAALTPYYVENASGLDLHQFKWLDSDSFIGEIPKQWNYLVGYDEPIHNVKNYHYTEGGPYFPDYHDCDFNEEWFAEKAKADYASE